MNSRILIITPVPLVPPVGGNRRRIRSICDFLMNEGWTLDLFYAGFDTPPNQHLSFVNGEVLDHDSESYRNRAGTGFRLSEIVNGLLIRRDQLIRKVTEGSESARHNQTLRSYRSVAKRELLKRQIDSKMYHAVLINYATYTHYFDLFPKDTLRIVDTHDQLSDRYAIFTQNGLPPPNWKSLSPAAERDALSIADRVWAISPREQDYFTELLKDDDTSVDLVPHLTEWNGSENEKVNEGLIYIGGEGAINVESLQRFFGTIWRHVIKDHPKAKLTVAGSICDMKDQFVDLPGVEWIGRFDDPEPLYRDHICAINPIPFGTGLKIKTLEALSYGKPVLTTSEGASGLERFEGLGMMVKDSPDEWIALLNSWFSGDQEPILSFDRLHEEMDKMNREIRTTIRESLKIKGGG